MNLNSCNDKQIEAIMSRDCSILVSAPAGSGKTKILVSRILSLLIEGTNVNELVVLTFTKAAASEMKQRLSEDLKEEIIATTDLKIKAHLTRQIDLLPQAYITNFHSFCLELLEQYGYLIDLDSSFTVLANNTLLKNNAFDMAFSNWAGDQKFQEFLKRRYPKYNFNILKKTIEALESLSNTIYDFENYVKDNLPGFYEQFCQYRPGPLSDSIKDQLLDACLCGLTRLNLLGTYCNDVGLSHFFDKEDKKESELSPYHSLLRYYQSINECLKTQPLERIIETSFELEKPYRMQWSKWGYDESVKAGYDELSKGIKDEYVKVFDAIVTPQKQERELIADHSLEDLGYLISLAMEYKAVYAALKKKQNCLDFNDLEQYAIRLLQKDVGVSLKLYHNLKEIMIDEYQDTNPIQENLIDLIGDVQEPVLNRFMVGDMKQSIYRFRDADPKIFKGKYDTFALAKNPNKRIELNYNYRSHKTVLDCINFIFNQIMDESIGGLEYYQDPNAQLNYDLKPDLYKVKDPSSYQSQLDHKTEVLLVAKEKGKYSPYEYEALAVATRIKGLLESGYGCSDILVLLRSMPQIMIFKNIFDKLGIANQIVLSNGFYSSVEITSLVSVIRFLACPQDDLALGAILLNNFTFSHFKPDLLVKVRGEKSLFENIAAYLEEHPDQEQLQQCHDYLLDLLEYSRIHFIDETIGKFVEDNDYRLFNAALKNGQQRLANIDLFIELLEDYRELSLIEITGEIEALIKNDGDIAPGKMAQSDTDAVSFMTIHKSKGLEAKVVIVASSHKQFNSADQMEEILFSNSLGLTTRPVLWLEGEDHLSASVRYENSYHQLLKSAIKKDMIDEEMRIFYVALTRAKEKLIITGQIASPEKIMDWAKIAIQNDYFIDETDEHVVINRFLARSNNYLDWAMMSIIRHPSILKQLNTGSVGYRGPLDFEDQLKGQLNKIMIYNANNQALFAQSNTQDCEFSLTFFESATLEALAPAGLHEITQPGSISLETFDLSTINSGLLPKTVAVTGLIDHPDEHYDRYDFTQADARLEATTRGTIIHRVLELLEKDVNIDLESELERIKSGEFAGDREASDLIDASFSLFGDFVKSDLFGMLCRFDHLYQEKKITAKSGDQIVHGVIDALGVSGSAIYIIDYKTDQVRRDSSDQDLIEIHEAQLNYYRNFVKRHFPDHEIVNCIHYFAINRTVTF